MVTRFFDLIHSEIRNLHEAAYLLGLFAVLAQLLAIVRDRLLASSFGAGEILDIYFAAFRIPDIIYFSVASLVSIYVLIPFLAEYSAVSKERERKFISDIFSAFTLTILVISALVFIFVPTLNKFLFSGLAAGPFSDDFVLLTRIMLLQPILLGMSNLFGSVTQTRRKFILYALSPILYNVGIILGLLFLYPIYGMAGLGMGVVLGALLHLSIQIPFIIQSGFIPRFSFSLPFKEIKRVVALSLPRTLGLSVHHLSLLVLISFAGAMTVGSISIFNLALNLQAVPFTIIAVSYSVAAFPTLSRLFTDGDRAKFIEHIMLAARHILFWSLPAIAVFVVLRAQIVRTILGAGAFDWVDTRLTAAALALFTVSLAAHGLLLLFVRGYYAAGNTIKPLVINVFGAILAVLFSFGLIQYFNESVAFQLFIESLLRVEGLPGTVVLMLPLGYSLAILINSLLLWFLFRKDFQASLSALTQVPFSRTFIHSLAASLVIGLVAHYFLDIFDDIFNLDTFWGIFLQGLLSGIAGIAAGILTLFMLKNNEIREVWESLHRRFWKTGVISPEQEEI